MRLAREAVDPSDVRTDVIDLSRPTPGSGPATPPPVSRTDEDFRRLKAQLHHQLISAMALAAIGTLNKDQLRAEVRRVAEELCQRSSSLLNRSERDQLVNEVLNETFGLGP